MSCRCETFCGDFCCCKNNFACVKWYICRRASCGRHCRRSTSATCTTASTGTSSPRTSSSPRWAMLSRVYNLDRLCNLEFSIIVTYSPHSRTGWWSSATLDSPEWSVLERTTQTTWPPGIFCLLFPLSLKPPWYWPWVVAGGTAAPSSWWGTPSTGLRWMCGL